MHAKKLQEYIMERVQQGSAVHDVREQLRIVGWTETQIDHAHKEAMIALGVPVPTMDDVHGNNITASSTVDIIVNVFSFIMLGVVAIACGVLLYSIINTIFPDPISSMYDVYTRASVVSMHYAIAALIVGYPMYVWAMRFWLHKGDDPSRVYHESAITRWVTYIVLLIAAVTIIGDVITVIFYVLQGEFTMRFVLKACAILIIAGGVFGVYYFERKKMHYHVVIPMKVFVRFGYIYAIIFVLAIMTGLFVTGLPQAQRERTLDEKRSEDLATIADCVTTFAMQYERLPVDMDELYKRLSYCVPVSDPETSQEYTYHVVTAQQREGDVQSAVFELCAVFAQDTQESVNLSERRVFDKWHIHQSGQDCISETVVTKNFTHTVQ